LEKRGGRARGTGPDGAGVNTSFAALLLLASITAAVPYLDAKRVRI
jgi:hypothetical protein